MSALTGDFYRGLSARLGVPASLVAGLASELVEGSEKPR